jgi:aconitate hydratase 2/2-methylisocitrate dehydratase
VLSKSASNFPNRLGDRTNVYLASVEMVSVGNIIGRSPRPEEYF